MVTQDYATYGGGIYNAGTLTINNSTLSDNKAESSFNKSLGGGIYNSAGTLNLTKLTLGNNIANFGSGIDSGTSLIFNGNTSLASNIRTNGNQTYNGAVTLQGNTTLTGTDINFQNTVDGNQSLTVNASGITHFEKSVGGTTALASLTTDAAGSTQINDNIATTGSQTYNDLVTLTGNTTLKGQDINFQSTVDGNQSLTVNADNNITIAPGVSLEFTSGSGSIIFTADADNNNTGNFSMDTSQFISTLGRNLTISGTSITAGVIDTSSKDNVGINGGNITLTATNGFVRATQLNSASETYLFGNAGTGGNISVDATQDINIQGKTGGTGSPAFASILSQSESNGTNSNSTNAGNISLRTTGGNITIGGEVDTRSQSNGGGTTGNGGDVSLISENGNITINGLIFAPSASSKGSVTIGSSGQLDLNNNIASAKDVDISANEINFTGNINGTGNLVLQPFTITRDIAIGVADNSNTSQLNLTTGEINNLQNGFSSITIGRSDSSGAISVAGNVTFNDPVTLRSPSVGSINFNSGSNLNTNNNSLTLNAGQDITLNSNSTISTGTGNVQLDATRAIKLNSGSSITTTSGSINLHANQGGIRSDSSTVTTTTGNITLQGTNNTTGNGQDGILLYDNSVVRSQDGNIRLEGTSNANGENNDGVEINDGIGNIVETTGSGNTSIIGTATVGGEGVNTGRIKTNTGSINIIGTGTNDPDGAIKVFQVESTGGGNITLTGDTINIPRTDHILKSTGDLTIDGNTNLGANSTLIGNNITFKGTINGANALTVNASGITDFQQAIGRTTPLNSLTTDAAGKTQINANVTTTGSQTYNDTVEIQNPITLTTTNKNIAFNKTVDSQSGEANDLTLNSGTGNVSFNDSVGNTTALGNLNVNSSGTTLFNNTVKAASLTTDEAGTTNINGNITTTGNQTFDDIVEIQNPVTLSTTNSNIAFNKTVESQSGEANDLTLNSGTGNVSFNNSVGDTTALGNLSVNNSGTTLFNNTVKAASLITDATGSSQINGNITTTGNQTYNDTVEIQNPVTLTTTNSNIAFDKTVDSQSGEANNLTINSGTGNVSFNDSVGNITSLGNLNVNSGGTTLFNNTVTATSLTTDAEGSSQINGNITTTGSQTYNDAVNLQGNTTLTGNNVAFQNTVDGNQALTVNSSGVTHFEKAVGNTTALNSLTTDATGTTEIKDNIKTTGNQTYNDAVTLKGNSTLTGSNLTLSNVTGTTNNFSVIAVFT